MKTSPASRLLPLSLAALTIALSSVFYSCLGSSTDSGDPDPLTDLVPVITAQPRDTTVSEGSIVYFTVEATGALTYQWVRNDTDTLEGENLPILILMGVSLADDGNRFKCVAGNFKGIAVSASAALALTRDSNPPDTTDSLSFVSRSTLLANGETVYTNLCSGCHWIDGRGTAGGAAPLANADFVMNNRRKAIEIVLAGSSDSMLVNGIQYYGAMPPLGDMLGDVDIASVLTYIRVVFNDSTVTNCGLPTFDGDGLPVSMCQKTPRTPAEIAIDSISVQEVRAVRDSLFPPF